MCEVRLLPPYSTLKSEAVDSSVSLVAVYKIVWQRISEDYNHNINDYILLSI